MLLEAARRSLLESLAAVPLSGGKGQGEASGGAGCSRGGPSATAAALGCVPQLYAKGETPREGRLLDPTKSRGSLRHVAPALAPQQQAGPPHPTLNPRPSLNLPVALNRTLAIDPAPTLSPNPDPQPSPSPNTSPDPHAYPKPGRTVAVPALRRLLAAAGRAGARAAARRPATLGTARVLRRAPRRARRRDAAPDRARVASYEAGARGARAGSPGAQRGSEG